MIGINEWTVLGGKMAHEGFEFVRKLTRQGKYSYILVLPPEIVDHLKWRVKQKLTVKVEGERVVVEDWTRKKRR